MPAPYCREVNLKGEALYWIAQLGGLESAFGSTTIATTVAPGVTTTTVTESDEPPEFEWNLGFRVGLEYALSCNVLEADWTHYDGHATFSQGVQNGHWNLEYDTIDLIYGRRCCVSSCFLFKPFIGARGLRIRQNLFSHIGILYTALIGNNTVFTNLNDKEKVWGVGPEIGVEADWYLGKNFSLYGSFDVVTYYGHFMGTYLDSDIFTTTVSNNNSRISHDFNVIGTDLALGVRWDKAWPIASEGLLSFKAGLEQHRIYDISKLGTDGTLSLDGAVFMASVGYRY